MNNLEVENNATITEDMITPISPERPLQPVKTKMAESNDSVTPSRLAEKKPKIDKKEKMDARNIEAMLNDDSD